MNIILIGMPGCGKSTIGVILAKSLLSDFIDTDLLIQNKFKKSLCEIINEEGIESFKDKENQVLKDLKAENSVIATGGSAVYCEEGMKNLKKDGKVVYLNLPPKTIKDRIDNITTRGIAMEKGTTIDALYSERAPLYEKYTDYTVNCENLSVEETVKKITELIKN